MMQTIHQTRPPPSITAWSSSDSHLLVVGAFGCGRGQPDSMYSHIVIYIVTAELMQNKLVCILFVHNPL